MPMPATSTEMKQAAADAVLNTGSVSAAARELGLSRRAVQHRLDKAEGAGLLTKPRADANPSRWRPGEEIVAARKAEFARVKAAGDYRTMRKIHLPDAGPFCVVFLGDPHLDSPGTDLELWERWIAVLDIAKAIYGFGLGDWLDNWVRPLAFLYGNSEIPAPEGWILLNHYLDRIGPHLIASVAGNHDDWSGHSDVLGGLMAKHEVLHRSKGLRVALALPGGREITIGARHRWVGRSMWNEVHAIKRAARMGQRDTILVGGDLHVSGESLEKDPDTGRISHCLQVAAFKVVDDYADDKGFLDRHISPAVACVIDPSRPDTDPELVRTFHDPALAAQYLAMLRGQMAAVT